MSRASEDPTDLHFDREAATGLRDSLPKTWRTALALAPDRERRLLIARWQMIAFAVVIVLLASVAAYLYPDSRTMLRTTYGHGVADRLWTGLTLLFLPLLGTFAAGLAYVFRSGRAMSASLTMEAAGIRYQRNDPSRFIPWEALSVAWRGPPLTAVVLSGNGTRIVLSETWIPADDAETVGALPARPYSRPLKLLARAVLPLEVDPWLEGPLRELLLAELSALSGRRQRVPPRWEAAPRWTLALLLLVPMGAYLLWRIDLHRTMRAAVVLEAQGPSRESIVAAIAASGRLTPQSRLNVAQKLLVAGRLDAARWQAEMALRHLDTPRDRDWAKRELAAIDIADGQPRMALARLEALEQQQQFAHLHRALAFRCLGEHEATARELDAAVAAVADRSARTRDWIDSEAAYIRANGKEPWRIAPTGQRLGFRRKYVEALMAGCPPPG